MKKGLTMKLHFIVVPVIHDRLNEAIRYLNYPLPLTGKNDRSRVITITHKKSCSL